VRGNLLGLLGRLTTWKVTQFATDSDGFENWEDDRKEASIIDGANVVSSAIQPVPNPWLDIDLNPTKMHAVLLDLDVPAYLVPSTRPGHSHLYVDVQVTEERYFNLLDALAECGVIERGYANASKKKGGTFLRLPWIKKEGSNQ
jgi:hypothetical protein